MNILVVVDPADFRVLQPLPARLGVPRLEPLIRQVFAASYPLPERRIAYDLDQFLDPSQLSYALIDESALLPIAQLHPLR